MKSSTGRGWRESASWRPTRCWPSPLNACWSRGASWECRVCGCSSYATRSTGTSPRCAATRTGTHPEPAQTFLAVTRRRLSSAPLDSRPAYQLLQALLEGRSVGQAFSAALEGAGSDLELLPHNLWTWFHDWAAEGFFRAVELG